MTFGQCTQSLDLQRVTFDLRLVVRFDGNGYTNGHRKASLLCRYGAVLDVP